MKRFSLLFPAARGLVAFLRDAWQSVTYFWKVASIRQDVKIHGPDGAKLREAIRVTPAEEIGHARAVFGQKFATYSNRARAAWLDLQGIEVRKIAGLSHRQCQQRAALEWFDRTRGGAST